LIVQSIIGLFVFLLIAWLVGENRRRVAIGTIVGGVGLQLALGLLLLKLPVFQGVFLALNKVILALEEATRAGTSFVFGFLGGGEPPFTEITPGASYILAFRGLPLVLVVSALSSLLFYWKILPVVVRAFSWALQRTMRIGGAEGFSVASNVFLGMVESPLVVKPYLKQMTRSELFSIMTVGMAGVAGTVMVLYASILGPVVPDALGHILIASIISAPAGVVLAKLMIPETKPITTGKVTPPVEARSWMDAITRGTTDGIQLLVSIIAMIIVLVALVYLVNVGLRLLPDAGGSPITLQRIFGYVMAPVMWLVGIPWSECMTAGSLMGTKTVLNELIAYVNMSQVDPAALSDRSRSILTYAMCGFANPGSLGIMIGGMGAMVPERREEIVSLGLRTILSGTLATCMTGAIAAMFI
jgi:concentrative nucleoside transporter, CNT family